MKADPRYSIFIYWSADDQAFIAEVPELPGCAADGETYELALANVKTAVQEWIATAQALGRDLSEVPLTAAQQTELERRWLAFQQKPDEGEDDVKRELEER
jgi:predicted RNase H-like HicB family nuclease